jgi:hypothetical protein
MPESVKIPDQPNGLWTLIRRIRRVGLRRFMLLGQTFCLLLMAKIALRIVPVDRVLSWKSTAASSLRDQPPLDQSAECQLVRWAVTVVSERSPIQFVCFPQSLAARALLHHRGIQTQLYYGAARKAGVLVTHTWLQVGEKNIVGGEVAHEFSVLQTY